MALFALRSVLFAALLSAAAAHAGDCGRWAEWQTFKERYLSEDGRVIDSSTPQSITVSEGQAYALTFALIANDPSSFERVLGWTQNNLSAGNLEHTLPAWKWGRGADGKWSVLDPNSASDADLWIAYTLGQAALLWHKPAYAQLSRALSEAVLRDEVSLIPGLGPSLLPGPKGFVAEHTWRLNASYTPLQVLRAIARQSSNPLWSQVIESSSQLILASAPRGYAADWIQYRDPGGFLTDSSTQGVGSYNAIRVYLWAGMLSTSDPLFEPIARKLEPMASDAAARPPPESVNSKSPEIRGGEAPPGFSAALLPLLAHFKLTHAVQSYRGKIATESLKDDQHYYSDALTLFGLGWLDGHYRFDRQGDLKVEWTESCHAH